MGAGAEPAAAPQRSDPESCRDRQGLRAHEKEVFQQIAESRAKLSGAQTPADAIAAANQQSAALARLLVIVENYPNLKANEQFNRLSDELAGTENRIAVERMRYNERVQEYNTSRRQFPGVITAKIFGFKDYPLFEAPASAQQVPKVAFLGLGLPPAGLEQLALEVERALDEVVRLLEALHPLGSVRRWSQSSRSPRRTPRGGFRTASAHPCVRRSTACQSCIGRCPTRLQFGCYTVSPCHGLSWRRLELKSGETFPLPWERVLWSAAPGVSGVAGAPAHAVCRSQIFAWSSGVAIGPSRNWRSMTSTASG